MSQYRPVGTSVLSRTIFPAKTRAVLLSAGGLKCSEYTTASHTEFYPITLRTSHKKIIEMKAASSSYFAKRNYSLKPIATEKLGSFQFTKESYLQRKIRSQNRTSSVLLRDISSVSGLIKEEIIKDSVNKNENKKYKPSDFNISTNTDDYLKKMEIDDLIINMIVYKCCSKEWLVKSSPFLIDLANQMGLGWLSNAVVRNTFFKVFCAGETEPEIVETVKRLHKNNIKSMLDLSVESDVDTNLIFGNSSEEAKPNKLEEESKRLALNKNADDICRGYMQSIDMAASQNDSFVALKITGLIPTDSLYRLSLLYDYLLKGYSEVKKTEKASSATLSYRSFHDHILMNIPGFKSLQKTEEEKTKISKELFESIDRDGDGKIDWIDLSNGLRLDNPIARPLYLAGSDKNKSDSYNSLADGSKRLQGANSIDILEYDTMIRRIQKLANHAQSMNVSLVVDAEHSYFQPIIDQATISTMKKYNSFKSKNKLNAESDYFKRSPLVFNTYQLYTKSGLIRLQEDYELSIREGWAFGAKLVRGAYMYQERDLAKKLKYESPINETIEETHNSYNNGVKFMLENIAKKKNELESLLKVNKGDKVVNISNPSLVIASHNSESSQMAINEIISLGIPHDSKTVCFAQLLGMQDSKSYKIAELGFNSYKYVPYGPIEETMPYLIRRAQENSAILETANQEFDKLSKELYRRMNS
ncbi:Proline dehydrogenase 1, mitochondrial [Smittium mucronatum]|uniref:Proline dehydrogenase n=1 Tax=Smittium mucronatum TaxID=133383 RepID=A0A1R0GZL8_9FUNG|nr:Proline dehydrogenase 1, mitochondrial [Smittium mucronatum]